MSDYQEVTIRLPKPLMLDGVEYEPTGEWRCPKAGEYYLHDTGDVTESTHGFSHTNFIILRPKWKWPSALKARWLAKNSNETYHAFAASMPEFEYGESWHGRGGISIGLPGEFIDFTPIPGEASESLRENPDWKEPNDA